MANSYNNKKSLFITQIILFLSVNMVFVETLCNKRTSKIAQIQTPKEYKHISLQRNSIVTQTTCPKNIRIAITKRSRWTKYCTAGPFNHDCTTETRVFPITLDEVLFYEKEGLCSIGYLCKPYGECWGSDADKCNDDRLTTKIKEREHTWVGEEYTVKWKYSCISSWDCLINIVEVPLFMERSIEDDYNLLFYDNKGKKRYLDKTIKQNITEIDDGYHIHILDNYNKCTSVTREISCMQGDNINLVCIWLNEGKTSGEPFIIDMTRKDTFSRNKRYKVLKATYRSGNKIIDYTDNTGKDLWDNWERERLEEAQPTSLESVKEVLRFSYFKQMENEINFFIERENRKKLESIIISMVKSLSKLDDELIGNLMQQKIRTEWISEDIFEVFPCANIKPDPYTNCDKNTYYENGRRYMSEGGHDCKSVDKSKVKTLKLLDDIDFDFFNIQEEMPITSAETWDGWSKVNSFEKSVMKVVGSTNKGDQSETKENPFFSSIVFRISNFTLTIFALIMSTLSLIIVSLRR